MRSLRESSSDMGDSSFRVGWATAPVRPRGQNRLSRGCPRGWASPRDFAHPTGRAMTRLIHVLQIALAALQLNNRRLGFFGADRLHVGVGAHQGRPHVLRHLLGIAAYIEIGALVEPLDRKSTRLNSSHIPLSR